MKPIDMIVSLTTAGSPAFVSGHRSTSKAASHAPLSPDGKVPVIRRRIHPRGDLLKQVSKSSLTLETGK